MVYSVEGDGVTTFNSYQDIMGELAQYKRDVNNVSAERDRCQAELNEVKDQLALLELEVTCYKSLDEQTI